MFDTSHLDVGVVHACLREAVRRGGGCRASRLMWATPRLVELLAPDGAGSARPADRALTVEALIRNAVAALGGDAAEALTILLGLAPGTVGRSLEDRRRRAARVLGIQVETFRRPRYEDALLFDLAVEVYRLCCAEEGDAA